jgi:hypothetical protein
VIGAATPDDDTASQRAQGQRRVGGRGWAVGDASAPRHRLYLAPREPAVARALPGAFEEFLGELAE